MAFKNNGWSIVGGYVTDEVSKLEDYKFSGRVLLYYEGIITIEEKAELAKLYRERKLDLGFFGPEYLSIKLMADREKDKSLDIPARKPPSEINQSRSITIAGDNKGNAIAGDVTYQNFPLTQWREISKNEVPLGANWNGTAFPPALPTKGLDHFFRIDVVGETRDLYIYPKGNT
jgi:hypothetical protein